MDSKKELRLGNLPLELPQINQTLETKSKQKETNENE